MKRIILCLLLVQSALIHAQPLTKVLEFKTGDTLDFRKVGIESRFTVVKSEEGWDIITADHSRAQKVEGFMPLYTEKKGKVVFDRVMFCKTCHTEITQYGYEEENSPVQITPDPFDTQTWYDSLDSEGVIVYGKSTRYYSFNTNANSYGVLDDQLNEIIGNFTGYITVLFNSENGFISHRNTITEGMTYRSHFATGFIHSDPDGQFYALFAKDGSPLDKDFTFTSFRIEMREGKYVLALQIDEVTWIYFDQHLNRLN